MIIGKTSHHFRLSCVAPGASAKAAAFLPGMVAAALLTLAPLALASDQPLAGAKDHPIVSRYQGSSLVMTGEAPVSRAEVVVVEKGKPVLRPVEGKIFNYYYVGPAGSGALEVYRNYRQALETAQFDLTFACETVRCVDLDVQYLIKTIPREAAWVENRPTVLRMFGDSPNFHFISARKMTPAGPVYVQVGVVTGRPGSSIGTRTEHFVQVVEPGVSQTGKVTVNAQAIRDGLERDGKVAFYGVLFDTNKAEIKEESAPQLAEMAAALKAASGVKAYVVGHTDNHGDLAANMALSQKRAQAVVDALSRKYGIATERLVGRGVANLAPVAANGDEKGRARNRRVELVLQ